MKLYLKNGYFDFKSVYESVGVPFIFITGGRGTGKTFGALKYFYDRKTPIMFLRRTNTQIDTICEPAFSPFKPLNEAYGWSVIPEKITKYIGGFYEATPDTKTGKLVPSGDPFSYLCAINTIANIRGFDASAIDCILFDEFIPEAHERTIRGEAAALFNAYETINRNRELNGRPPCKLVCLSNSNKVDNTIFSYLGIVRKIENMKKKGKTIHIDRTRHYAVILLDDSPISNKKRSTAIYDLTSGTEFSKMSLDNDFNIDDSNIKIQSLNDYRFVVNVGRLSILRHRAKRRYYVCGLINQNDNGITYYTDKPADLRKFSRRYSKLYAAYLDRKILFDSAESESLYNSYNKPL